MAPSSFTLVPPSLSTTSAKRAESAEYLTSSFQSNPKDCSFLLRLRVKFVLFLLILHFARDMSVVVDGERQLISELGHMILDHIQQNMWTFSTSLVATILLQHPRGICISE